MNLDDIIRMAREAGMERVHAIHADGTKTIELPHPDTLERFANLVASAEREAISKSLDKQADLACDEIDRQWAQEMAAAVRARREK